MLRGHVAQCRGVECAKNSEYNDKELHVLFVVGRAPQGATDAAGEEPSTVWKGVHPRVCIGSMCAAVWVCNAVWRGFSTTATSRGGTPLRHTDLA